MDIFDFEELTAEMLDITDEQREDSDYLPSRFFDKYEIDFELAFTLARDLVEHTPTVEAGISGKVYHAFISKKDPVMLMKIETKSQ